MISVFPAHSPADASFARDLTLFLESGCDSLTVAADAALRPGENLLSAAERGLSTDILLLILSPASNLARWPRDRWEPILFGDSDTRVGVLLLETCAFPDLFRRKLRFFDATSDRRNALRQVKRWVKGNPPTAFSPALEPLYLDLADRPGTLTAPLAQADRFAEEAAGDFAAVCRIPAHAATLAQAAGHLGAQLGMWLDGPLEDNCRRIRDLLRSQRCLVVSEAPGPLLDRLMPEGGRTSFLIAPDAVAAPSPARTLAAARALVAAGRLAEAYEILQDLYDAGIDSESCARELTWICDHWGWYVEAGLLRSTYRLAPVEQLSLF